MPQIVNKKSVLDMAMGAIAEITDYEVERVVANIMDPNTSATAKRKITITLTFAPDDYRQQIGMDAQAKTALAPIQPVRTSLCITKGRDGSLLLAEMTPQVPGQVDMDGDETPMPAMARVARRVLIERMNDMEVSFLKDAIDRVAEMAKPFTFEFAGRQFCSAELHEIRPEVDFPARYSVDTLDALVKLIRTEGAHYSPLLYVRVDSARRVVVDTTYTGAEWAAFTRAPLYEAVTDVPSITVNQNMNQDRAVIELQSLYAVTDDRDYLLALLSRIDVNQGVSSVDNGISQEVSVRTGAVLKEQQTVQPIVRLQPYRTFLEVEQPASDFLLRLDKEGRPALYEADGGAWKLEAKRSIAAYLGEQLADLVESGNVVVMI